MSSKEKIQQVMSEAHRVFTHQKTYQTDMDTFWQVITDTEHMSRLMGLDSAEITESPIRDGVSERTVFWPSLKQTFTEEPYVWEYGKWYGVIRKNGKGPLQTFTQLIQVEEVADGIQLTYQISLRFHHSIKGLFFWIVSSSMSKSTEEILDKIDFHNANPIPLIQSHPVNQARLSELRAQLIQEFDEVQVERFLDVLANDIDTEVKNSAPYLLAKNWAASSQEEERLREDLLNMFLTSTKLGYTAMQWSLICPSCRGAKSTVDDLSKLRMEAHCDSCNIQFGARFAESVQVTFCPSPSLRQVEQGMVCVAGPRRTPHQVFSRFLQPNEVFELDADLILSREGRLVIRSMEGNHQKEIHEVGHFTVDNDGFQFEPGSVLSVQNLFSTPVRVVVQEEELPTWVLTAAEVIRKQLFVDYFSHQLLDPSLQAEVGTVTLMFSDLVGSTKLYQERGDAQAFAVVNEHFEILKSELNAHQGTLVKTAGDAILGVFEQPEFAVRCALAMHKRMLRESELGLRLGLHVGPCLAVTFNERLDYFGRSVNLAARMEQHCNRGEIVLSEPLYTDPEVQTVVRQSGVPNQEESIRVKGVEHPLKILRLHVV